MTPRRTRTLLRPTIFGVVVVLILAVTLSLRVPVADPSVAGLVWAGLAAAALLGALWPIVTVRTVGMRIVRAPTDVVVGELSSLDIELTGRASGLTLRCAGSPLLVADVVSPGVTRIPLEVAVRGAYRSIRVDVGSDAPFGIVSAQRGRTLELPRRLLVGPATVPTEVAVGEIVGQPTDALPRGVSMSGESVRAVRPYVTGDPSHLVHWPTTARLGSLVVRELEPPVSHGLAIVLDLNPPLPTHTEPVDDLPQHDGGTQEQSGARQQSGAQQQIGAQHWAAPRHTGGAATEGISPGAFQAIEHAAGRAAGAAEHALAEGARVVLCTVEDAGPVVDEVVDLLGMRRRLALAVDGAPPAPPDGWPVLHISAGAR